jgi:hypothetical protein
VNNTFSYLSDERICSNASEFFFCKIDFIICRSSDDAGSIAVEKDERSDPTAS